MNVHQNPTADVKTLQSTHTTAPAAPQDAPHNERAEAVVATLGSDVARGLHSSEAQRRLDQYGLNQLKSAPETPWWKRLLEQFENFLVIILLVAVVISMIEWVLQDPRETALPYEAIVILLIVILNAMLGFIQEARAEKSVRALMALAAPEATVGARRRAPAHRDQGDRPRRHRADRGRRQDPGGCPHHREREPADRRGAADRRKRAGARRRRSRSKAMSASATARTCCTPEQSPPMAAAGPWSSRPGMSTEVGRIAGLLEAAEKEPTPLQQELDRTGKRLSIIMLAICAVVFAAGLLTTKAFTLNIILSLFLFAVALAVAAIPEALPAIVTVGLSLGVRRMAAANAIVRKLPAVETLGAATVICSDKTGTLTRNEMTVRAVATAAELVDVGGSGYIPEGEFTVDKSPLAENSPVRSSLAEILRAAALANDAELVNREGRWRVQGDPTEGALVVAARKFGIDESQLARFPRIAEIPFTSERKRHATVHRDRDNPAELRVFVKGAPEVLLAKSRFLFEDGKMVPLNGGAPRGTRYGATKSWRARRCARSRSRPAPCQPPLSASIRKPPPAVNRTSSCRRASRTS